MPVHYLPSNILLGRGVLQALPEHLARLPGHRALLVTDAGVVELGMAEQVKDLVEASGREVAIFSGVSADPTLEQVSAGIRALVEEKCDSLVAVGGGSPIDCAKAIALVARSSALGRVGAGHIDPSKVPLAAIPTTAGTGSEATRYLVITDAQAGSKVALTDPASIPELAVCDAELTRSLPPHVTAHTGMDALAHAVESFLSFRSTAFSGALAAQAAALVAGHLLRAVEHGQEDIAAREGMMEAQLLAGMSFSNAGLGYVHALAHTLGARFGLPHGLANAVMLPPVLEYILPQVQQRLARLAWAFPGHDPGLPAPASARRVSREIRNLAQSIGIPARLQDLEIPRAVLPELAGIASRDPVAEGSPVALNESDLLAIYQAAWAGP